MVSKNGIALWLHLIRIVFQRCTRCMKAASPAIQTREGSLFQSQHFYRNNVVAQLSKKPAYPISLKQMVAFGKDIDDRKLISSANFVCLLMLESQAH